MKTRIGEQENSAEKKNEENQKKNKQTRTGIESASETSYCLFKNTVTPTRHVKRNKTQPKTRTAVEQTKYSKINESQRKSIKLRTVLECEQNSTTTVGQIMP